MRPSWGLTFLLATGVVASIVLGCGGGGSWADPYTVAVSRIQGLTRAATLYMGDYDDAWMPAGHWSTLLQPYAKDPAVFVSPEYDHSPGKFGFAFNAVVAGRNANDIADPDNTLLFFDSTDLGRDAVDSVSTLPVPGRYSGRNALSYCSGRVPNGLPSPGAKPIDVSVDRLKHLSLAGQIYMNDWDDTFTTAPWMDNFEPYEHDSSVYRSPRFDGTANYGYALNQDAVGVIVEAVDAPANFLTFFDSTLLTRQAVGAASTIPSPGRYDGLNAISFLDGHAVAANPEAKLNTHRR